MDGITNIFFYPHKLQVKDTGGNWQNETSCRDQPNAGGKPVTTASRTNYVFQSLIFTPKGSFFIKPGQQIRILGSDNEIRLTAEVVKFSNDLFCYRIWV